MKKIQILLFAAFMALASLPLCAQVSIKVKNMPLTKALAVLEQQSGYSFFYSNSLPARDAIVSVEVKDKPIEAVLEIMLEGLPVAYEIKKDRQITLYAKTVQTTSREEPRKISGRVKDEDGFPVIGAGVLLSGTSDGTVTDNDGYYELNVPSSGTVLEFSYLGFGTVKRTVGENSSIDVVLKPDTQFLDEVVVVGYGVQKKVNLTGSVSMISSEDMASRPVSSVSSGLQGMLPGVTVINSSGQPGGSNTTIRVRGIGTIGNSNPLILVDGVEGDISSLNPEDIESVSVLKDAASAAIYGARAANGVLLVTTKKLADAKKSTPKVSLGAYFG
ncbi:MAG: TonB-dependent receptor plug domain-containing protein, partial [Candidatus Cryptobacteroides sp.]